MSHLQNQTALITGGSSGIGLAIASMLLEEGMAVAIAARDKQKLDQARQSLEKTEKKGAKVIAIPADVSKAEQVAAFVEQAVDAFGRIDLLVNNAGIARFNPIEDLSEEDWDETQNINLKGAFLCTKAVLPVMKRQGSGYVINISSVAGKSGFTGASAYCASKFGMIGLTESLLEEAIQHQIRATAICPGYVATPMVSAVPIPQGEMIPPEDIGKLVVGLLHLSPLTIIKEIVVNRKGSIGN
ncbi:MAG: SDR family oxidoreductase [Nitrospiria bacterium]